MGSCRSLGPPTGRSGRGTGRRVGCRLATSGNGEPPSFYERGVKVTPVQLRLTPPTDQEWFATFAPNRQFMDARAVLADRASFARGASGIPEPRRPSLIECHRPPREPAIPR